MAASSITARLPLMEPSKAWWDSPNYACPCVALLPRTPSSSVAPPSRGRLCRPEHQGGSLSAAGREWRCGHWWVQLCFRLEPRESPGAGLQPWCPSGQRSVVLHSSRQAGQGPCSAVVDKGPAAQYSPNPQAWSLRSKRSQAQAGGKKLKGLHATELQQAEERAAQHYGRQAEELREHLGAREGALGRQGVGGEPSSGGVPEGDTGRGARPGVYRTPRVSSTCSLAAFLRAREIWGGGGG